MSWWNFIKAKGIGGGRKDRSKIKVARGSRTVPRGSRQAKLEKLVNLLLSGKITEAEYRRRKEDLK